MLTILDIKKYQQEMALIPPKKMELVFLIATMKTFILFMNRMTIAKKRVLVKIIMEKNII